METDDMNFEILKSVTKSLKKSAKLIFTTLNGLLPLFHSTESFLSKGEKKNGVATYRSNHFDLLTLREFKTIGLEDDSGNKKQIKAMKDITCQVE